jgi:hypothetical protein
VWTTSADRVPWLKEGGKGTVPIAFHSQIRPNPLANIATALAGAVRLWRNRRRQRHFQIAAANLEIDNDQQAF